MKSKDKIIETLKKLKAMAEKGCNEQEVDTAARMLQKQMDKYGITLDELRDEKKAGAECERTDFKTRVKKGGDMNLVMGAIGRLFDCKTWYYNAQQWQFFGLPGDTQAACALAFLIEASAKQETAAYRKTIKDSDEALTAWNPQEYMRVACKDFRRGYLLRVAGRLRDMKQEQVEVQTKNALVIRKTEIVEAAMESQGIALRAGRASRTQVRSREHFENGQQRGATANLSVGGQVTQQ